MRNSPVGTWEATATQGEQFPIKKARVLSTPPWGAVKDKVITGTQYSSNNSWYLNVSNSKLNNDNKNNNNYVRAVCEFRSGTIRGEFYHVMVYGK